MDSIRVLLIDDHPMFVAGLRSLLEERSVTVLGETGDGSAGVRLAAELRPDVVLVDLNMPGLGGVETTRQILREHPLARVIGLSMYSDPHFVSAMLEAGAAGYLPKNSDPDELMAAIRAAAGGRTYLSPRVAGSVINGYLRPRPKGPAPALSARESEVLRLLAEGRANREIALLLRVGGKTVETYRRRIMSKLGLHTVAELVKYALREGLTPREG